jgi:hypothetical protein
MVSRVEKQEEVWGVQRAKIWSVELRNRKKCGEFREPRDSQQS